MHQHKLILTCWQDIKQKIIVQKEKLFLLKMQGDNYSTPKWSPITYDSN